MKSVSARTARASISALLDLAEAGERTLIIRNSKAAAVIGPVPSEPSLDGSEEVRWYSPRGSSVRIGFVGSAGAAFLALPRDDRARILDAFASIGPIVITRP